MLERDLLFVPIVAGEREMVLHEYIDTEAAANLRRNFGIEPAEFAAILIDKDGTEKLRRRAAVELSEVFAAIDSTEAEEPEVTESTAA